MRKHILNPGEVFGRLEVVREHGKTKRGETLWLCVCVCGVKKAVPIGRLRSGKTSSCGCLHRESAAANGHRNRTHGHASSGTQTRTYKTWVAMVQRCSDPKTNGWEYYGGRGIGVCARWKSFENFIEDMGERPKKRTLDRIDTNGNYEKANCRWATNREQAENHRNTIFIEHNGVSKTIRGWAEHLGIPRATIYTRYRKGLPVAKQLAKGDHRRVIL